MVHDLHVKESMYDGTNFTYWKERIESYLEALQNGIQEIIQIGYQHPQNGPSTPNEIKAQETNAKAIKICISCLSD